MNAVAAVIFAILIVFFWPVLLLIPFGIGHLLSGAESKASSANSSRPETENPSGWIALAVGVGFLLLLVFFAIGSNSKSPSRPHPYWDSGDGRAIRDEQEHYQDRVPR
jgi:hypothetical protein